MGRKNEFPVRKLPIGHGELFRDARDIRRHIHELDLSRSVGAGRYLDVEDVLVQRKFSQIEGLGKAAPDGAKEGRCPGYYPGLVAVVFCQRPIAKPTYPDTP